MLDVLAVNCIVPPQDMMVQSLVEACPNLLYLNLSCTPVTNEALRALSRYAASAG